MPQDIIVTGLKPTGLLHLGSYLDTLKQLLDLQEEYAGRCFIFIADYHAMTQEEFARYPEYARQMAASLLALGVDPKKSTLFFQKDVPEVTELTWMFNTVTPVSFLERMTQYKDQAAKGKAVNAGLQNYPVLMAADILIYGGTHVPVGEDQLQHVELARDVARFWNNRFGAAFIEPKPIVTKTARVMALNHPDKKMSKSIPGSTIDLRAEPEEILSIVRGAVTDVGPKPKSGMSPGVQNLFTLLAEFAPEETVRKFRAEYNNGTIRYVELKDALAEVIGDHFAAFRKKLSALTKRYGQVQKILDAGGRKARKTARATMARIRKQIGFNG